MIKKTTSILLSFVLAFSLVGSSMVSFAASSDETTDCDNVITTDKNVTDTGTITNESTNTDIQTLDNEELIAFAVYSEDDGSLTFYSDTEQPSKYDVYNGKTVDDIFTKFENEIYTSGMDVRWHNDRNKIESVTFDESFKEIHPVSTSYWFYSFLNCTEMNGLQYLDTSNETNMDDMFYDCRSLTSLDLSSFDTSNVTSMESMFFNCYSLTELDFSSFNTSNVTSMSKMFSECSGITHLDLSNFDYTNVTSTSYMMNEMTNLESVIVGGTSQTSTITTTADMFYKCTNLKNIDFAGFNTENVTDMDAMFRECTSLEEVYINTLDAHKLTSANKMFQDCTSLTTIYSNDDIFNTGNLTTKNSENMFLRCTSLVGGNGTVYTSSTVNSKYAHIDLPGNKGYFTEYASSAFAVYSNDDNSLTFYSSSDMPNIGDTYNGKTTTNIYTEFDEITYKDITEVPWYDIRESIKSVTSDESFKDIEITNMDYWFDGFKNCTDFMLNNMDTSHLTSMEYTFFGCEGISDVNMLSGIDISKVDDISRTFAGCNNIENINGLSNLGSATDIQHIDYAFLGCSKLSDISGLSGWDMSNVSNMTGLFYYCTSLANVDVLSNWTTGSETKLDYMFAYCETLENVNGLSDWDTAKVTSAKNMFYNCTNLTDVSALTGWDTAKTADVSNMFDGCTSLTTLDFTGWDTSKVTSYSDFAVNCENLEKIIVGDKFDLFERTEVALVNNASTWYGTKTCIPVSTNYLIGVYGPDTYTTYVQNEDSGAHIWNPNPSFEWSEDYTACDIVFTCTICDSVYRQPCVVTQESTEATCTKDGKTTYTATWEYDEANIFTNQKTITSQEALGHIIDVAFEWSNDAYSCEAHITCERGDLSVTRTCTVTHKDSEDPTETTDGYYTNTASIEYEGITYTDDKTVTIPATGHHWDLSDPTWNWDESEDGTVTCPSVTIKCRNCDEVTTVGTNGLEVISEEPATCTSNGEIIYEASARFEGTTLTDTHTQVTPMTGHTPVTDPAVEPTCTETGLTEGSHCAVCGIVLVEQTVVPALGHNYVITSNIPATCTEDGEIIYTCTRCGDTYTEVFPATGHSWTETEYIISEDGNVEKIDVRLECSKCKTVLENTVTVETTDTGITAHADFDWSDFIDIETIAEYFDEGKDLDFVVQVNDYNESVSESNQKLVEEIISELYTNLDYDVFYIDIDLFMNIYNQDGSLDESIEYHESINPIAITIAIPDELLELSKTDENIVYKVIRIHNGEIEWLDTVDNGDGTITFISDLFSTYAVVAVDTGKNVDNTGDNNNNGDNNKNDGDNNNNGDNDKNNNGNDNTGDDKNSTESGDKTSENSNGNTDNGTDSSNENGSGETDASRTTNTENGETTVTSDNGGKDTDATDNGGKESGTTETEGAKTADGNVIIAIITTVIALGIVGAVLITNRKRIFNNTNK